MESMSKKSRSCESNDAIEDRLSGLPDEVILHILSLMPTLDAVRTMLLRRFRNLWTLVPAVRFDVKEYYDRMILIDDNPPNIHVAFSSFACFVRNVLMFHRRPTIDTFHLSIRDLGNTASNAKINGDVRTWLRYAVEREVKDLYFRYLYYDTSFEPPHCVFTSQSLTTLELNRCTIKHYENQSQMHMGMLRKLSLICVEGSTGAFDHLISGCPSLKELVVEFEGDPGFGILNINAPTLRKLDIQLVCYFWSCTLNCPNLKILGIGVYEYYTGEDESAILPRLQLDVIGVISLQEVTIHYVPARFYSGEVRPFFRLIQNAEVFTMSCEAFEQLFSIEKIEFAQNRWKRILLELEWNWERCLEAIFTLMKSSVNLEELIIQAEETSWRNDCELLCPKLTACVLPLLKTVTIHGNHGYKKWCEGQLQVIEFLLTNAVVLEKMLITFGEKKLTAAEKFELVKKVSSFRRASTNATVIFA